MYKLAFIGGGSESIAGYPHFIASQMDKRFVVVAGAFSTDKNINKNTSSLWRIPKVYDDWKELIVKEKENVDAVVVLVPTPLHKDVVVELLKNDIPVICEKPLVASMEEVNEISKIYNKDKHFLVITNNYSGYPMLRELQAKIAGNELGDILHMRLKMPQESFLRPPKSVKYPQKWRLKDGFIPMISLDLGSHLHHLSYFLLQEEPSKIMATYDSFSKYGVIDDVNMFLEYSSGIKGNIWLSKTALGYRNGLRVEVYGSKASAFWHQENPEKLEFSYSTGQKAIIDRGSDMKIAANPLFNRMTVGHPSGFIEAFANLYNDIANSIHSFRNNKKYTSQYVYGFEHAKKGLIILHKASISSDQKKWISIYG